MVTTMRLLLKKVSRNHIDSHDPGVLEVHSADKHTKHRLEGKTDKKALKRVAKTLPSMIV